MDNLDKLIEKLKETKEELAKGVNASYSAAPNASAGGQVVNQSEQNDKKKKPKESLELHKNGQWQMKGAY